MKLDFKEYTTITQTYKSLKNKRNQMENMQKLFPHVPKDTLENIFSQEYQRITRNISYKHHHNASKYYRMYLSRMEHDFNHGVLLNLADEVNMSPALFAQIILEQSYKKTGKVISAMMEDTTSIEDPRLASEIFICIISDEVYGPIINATRRAIGQEYEEKLKKELIALGLSYVDEEHLKMIGCDKTPDIKLDVPILINSRVVNWIESKASFGDKENHAGYLKNQYICYSNRYGPGLVVYWFGYIKELEEDGPIMLTDHFPTNIVFMEPFPAVKKSDSASAS